MSKSLVAEAREVLNEAYRSNFDPDLLEWAELVQRYLDQLDKHVFSVQENVRNAAVSQSAD